MIVRGYCQTKEQEILLRAVGLDAAQIFREGPETISGCIYTYRGRPGTLIVSVPLDKSFVIDNIRVVGIPARVFGDLPELIEALRCCKTLRRLFKILQ